MLNITAKAAVQTVVDLMTQDETIHTFSCFEDENARSWLVLNRWSRCSGSEGDCFLTKKILLKN